jgi:hypothetical protein
MEPPPREIYSEAGFQNPAARVHSTAVAWIIRRKLRGEGCLAGRPFQSASAKFMPSGATLVHFGKVHAVGKLQAGDLPCVVLNFQVRRHQRNVH